MFRAKPVLARRAGLARSTCSSCTPGRKCPRPLVPTVWRSDGRPAGLNSVIHDRADRFAGVHQIERVIDALERHLVGDEIVDVDLLLHVPVDDLGYVGATTRASERGSLPRPSGHQLERPRDDLRSRGRDTDDHRHTPSLVTTL